MSGRCKSCNEVLTEREMRAKNRHTGLPEDLCYRCRAIAFDMPIETAEEFETYDKLLQNYVHLVDE